MARLYTLDDLKRDFEDEIQASYLSGWRDGAANAPFWNRCYAFMLAALMFALGMWIGYLI